MPAPLRFSRTHRSPLAALLLVLYLPACTTWQIGTPTPAEFVTREHPSAVRVTRTDGRRLTMLSPVVVHDSLSGGVRQYSHGVSTVPTVTVALAEVRDVAVERTAVGKTLLVVGGSLVVITVVAWAIECDGSNDWNFGCP